MLTLLIDANARGNDAQAAQSNADSLYNALQHYINERYMLSITLPELSRHFNFSESYISHLFARYAGCGLRSHINNLRIQAAKVYLRSTKLSIRDIAFAVGYADSNYFSTQFRQRTAVSPREWRARCAGE